MVAMSVTHRGRPLALPSDDAAPSPPAARVGRRRWHDPHLWVGVLLVAVSVLVGARLLANDDDTTSAWRMTADVRPGEPITAADVDLVDVRLPDATNVYLVAAGEFPTGLQAIRPVSSGELLPASAVSSEGALAAPRELPLGVAAAGVPPGLGVGDVVDVWAVPPTDAAARPLSVLVEVPVVGLSGDATGGLSAERQVLVSVPESVDVATVLARLNGASVVLVRRAG